VYQLQVESLDLDLAQNPVDLRYVSYRTAADFVPTTREFVPPAYSRSEVRTQSGATSRRIWASRPGGGSLRLSFTNVTDTQADGLCSLWEVAKGTRYTINLPNRFLEGLDASLRAYLQLNSQQLMWSFVEPPVVTSVAPGVSSVTLNFKARGYGSVTVPLASIPDPPIELQINSLALTAAFPQVGIKLKAPIFYIPSLATTPTVGAAIRFTYRITEIDDLALSSSVSDVNFSRPYSFIIESLSTAPTFGTVFVDDSLVLKRVIVNTLALSESAGEIALRRTYVFSVDTLQASAITSQAVIVYMGTLAINTIQLSTPIANVGFTYNQQAAFDPQFNSVSLLLSFDGTNGSTTFIDSSSSPSTVTASGNAAITTTAPKFGTGALALDGVGDYLSVASGSKFQFGTGDLTVECWVYVDTGNSNAGLFTMGGVTTGLAVSIFNGNWYLTFAGLGGNSMGLVTAGVWQHLAVTRGGTSARMFINGNQLGATLTNSTNLTDNAPKIGYYYTTAYTFKGKVDEFRITKGVARYTSNFTSPTAAWPAQ
jgi:hypothetical protein